LLQERHSILLVDDERDIVNAVRRWLEADGFNVYGFADPVQALEYFQNNSNNVDLVLSDIRMRKLDGYELVKKIKAIRPQTKVVFMTALEFNEELSKTLPSIKIDGFLLKTGSLENLVNAIESVFLTSSIG
jgi:CheY-like chemotaxis protein